jgi:hypothetical protein
LAKKALPLTVTGGVLGLLMVVAALLPSHEARAGEISEEASRRAAEPFMMAKLKENGRRMARKASEEAMEPRGLERRRNRGYRATGERELKRCK